MEYCMKCGVEEATCFNSEGIPSCVVCKIITDSKSDKSIFDSIVSLVVVSLVV